MRNTKILYPLDDDMPQSEISLHEDAWKLIKKHLDNMKEGDNISFDQLFLDLIVTEEEYFFAIRSTPYSCKEVLMS